MPWSIDDRFRITANEAIVRFIDRNPVLSAHDDVAEALTNSARGMPDVGRYCPNVHAYAYFVLHTRANRIFALAFGQGSLAYQVPSARIAEAVAAGASVSEEIGDDWIVLEPWKSGAALAATWCRIAHDHAVAARPSSMDDRAAPPT